MQQRRWWISARKLEVLADMVRFAGAQSSPLRWIHTVVSTLAAGQRGLEEFFRFGCEVAQTLARRLEFAPGIVHALGQVFERWDGRGWPEGVRGEGLELSARIVQVAQDAVVFHRLGGEEAAVAVAKERGRSLRPCRRRVLPPPRAPIIPELAGGVGP